MSLNHHHLPAAGAILLAVSAGFFFISAHEPNATQHTATISPQRTAADAVTEQNDEALADMHAYAEWNLGAYADVPGTFGGSSAWSAGWHLHWLDVAYRGETIRLYHLSAKDGSGRRLIAVTTRRDEKPGDWKPLN